MIDGYEIVLGFDVSSTTIGWCSLLVHKLTKVIIYEKLGYIKPTKNGNLIDRLAKTRDEVKKLIETINPDYIAIEDIISFMKGHSTAKTIIMLTTFNRMIGLCAYDYLGRAPELFNVMSIRHGLKNNKILPKKEDIPELVAKHLSIKFPYQENKKGNLKPENFDMADSIAVALYYAFVLTGRVKRKKV